jgi:predicted metal-dependent peptidase
MRNPKFCAFAGVLACGKVEVADEEPTARTDGWNVRYGPRFIEQYAASDAELRFLVLHEAMHKAYRHLSMWKELHMENAQLANIATDQFVNLSLVDTDAAEGFITMLTVGVIPDGRYRGWSVRQIFDDLKRNGAGGGESSMDEHDWDGADELSEAEQQRRANEIQRAVRQGEIIRKKMQGKGTGAKDGVLGDLLQPKIDWRKLLHEFITETCAGRDESTWRKPNRRYIGSDIYMPSMLGTTMSELVVGFDTSGSCFGGEEMTRFASEIAAIIERVAPSKVHVIYWDTEVAGHQTFTEGQFAVQQLKPRGGGGTDGSVLFDYLRDKRINPQAIVQFTDGYVGSWGRSDWPTLWALTSDVHPPYGTAINLTN